MTDEAWMERGLCREVGGDFWFPEQGESTQEAKQICNRCEVKPECLEYALGHDERFGIWGGLSEQERRQLKRGGSISPSVDPALVERVRQLADEGLKDAEIGAHLGWSADRVYRLRKRHEIPGGRRLRSRPSRVRAVA